MEIFLLSLTVMMLLVVYFDLTSYIIPNWLNATVLVLYLALCVTHPEARDWQSALLAFGVVFAIGFVIFALNWMGGGDIKLLIATAPYIGFSMKLLDYMLIVTLLGGALSIALWLLRKAVPMIVPVKEGKTLPRILQHGAPVPYGLAIAAAFLYILWTGNINGIAQSYQLK